MQYQDRLNEAEARFSDLTDRMADPEVINDSDLYRKTAKAQSELSELVAKYREWKRAAKELEDARLMLAETDPDLQEMAQLEVTRLEPEVAGMEQALKLLLCLRTPTTKRT